MYLLLIVITIIICVLLGLIVLIQNPKGGGLVFKFFRLVAINGRTKNRRLFRKRYLGTGYQHYGIALIINVSVKGGVQKTQDQGLTKEQIQKII
jgi:preprotein translocase subunit SecG